MTMPLRQPAAEAAPLETVVVTRQPVLDAAHRLIGYDLLVHGAEWSDDALETEARHRRRTIETRDLFILATARSRSLSIATRNGGHLRGFALPVYDPFEDAHFV